MKWSLLFLPLFLFSQEYQVRTVAFYNLENLFDTVNDTLVKDDERTPSGAYGWTRERYERKIANLAQVISEIGKETTGTSPDILGVCEAENFQVLEDLVQHPLLKAEGYGIVHEDSPDERGIDVALLYKTDVFVLSEYQSRRLLLINEDGFRDYTRDQLVVTGFLDGEEISIVVNHWPSRSGGESRSKPNRLEAAKLSKRIVDSIQRRNALAKVLLMGDFNDDPVDDSLKNILKTQGKKSGIEEYELYNPMVKMFKKGTGTLAYRDRWNLFDQIIFTPNWLCQQKDLYWFWKAGVYAPAYLKVQQGPYKGYPKRTYVGTNYQGGYADHFPVYSLLLRAKD